MAVLLSPIGGVAAQFFDSNGNPLSGGLIYTYAAGTSTPVATYTSSSGLTQHSNPIVLDAAGRVPTGEIWLTDGVSYKFVIQTSQAVLIGSYDNIVGINSNYIAYTAQQEIQTATAGQTIFTLATIQYQPGTNNLSVFVDGVNQYGPGAQYAYVETSSTVVTFVSGLHVGASVKFSTATQVSSAATDAGNVSFTGVKGQSGSVADLGTMEGSDWVGFQPDGTGAVSADYSIQDKLRQTVSVKDFGAVGDGVTDDTDAIKAAITAADNIYLPEGTYLVSEALQLPGAKNFYGAGVNATIIKRTSTTPETIDGASVVAILYTSGRFVKVHDLTLQGETTAVYGIFFGAASGAVTNNSTFENLLLQSLKGAIKDYEGPYMTTFTNVNAQSCDIGFYFDGASFKTSLTFNSCWAENCGQGWGFRLVYYSVLNACGADYCNYTSTGNPYGTGFGDRATNRGVYTMNSSQITFNGCGAENSYGNGIFEVNGNNAVTLNNCFSTACSSTYVPDYGTNPNYAVGPIQYGNSPTDLTINSPLLDWNNSVVPVSYPTKPIAKLVAFNYSEGSYGAWDDTLVFVNSTRGNIGGDSNLFAGSGNYQKYCRSIYSTYQDPIITGVFTQDDKTTRQITLSGSGTIITIPFTSQSALNTKHTLRVWGRNNNYNSAVANAFAVDIGLSTLTGIDNLTSGNLFGVTSVTKSGLNLIITLSGSVGNPIMFFDIISENTDLIQFSSITLS